MKDKNFISYKIGKLMREYHSKGKIGNIEPRNAAHAQQIASAIAYSMKRHAG